MRPAISLGPTVLDVRTARRFLVARTMLGVGSPDGGGERSEAGLFLAA
jgi:hypothetical protein